jgi:hypothetical protein
LQYKSKGILTQRDLTQPSIKKDKMNIDDILNSDLLNSIIAAEDKDLADAGWNRKEVNDMADWITKKK